MGSAAVPDAGLARWLLWWAPCPSPEGSTAPGCVATAEGGSTITTSPACITSAMRRGGAPGLPSRSGRAQARSWSKSVPLRRSPPWSSHATLASWSVARCDHGQTPGRQHAWRTWQLGQARRPAGLEVVRRQHQVGHRSTPAAERAVVVHQTIAQGLLGRCLQAPGSGWCGPSGHPAWWSRDRNARPAVAALPR